MHLKSSLPYFKVFYVFGISGKFFFWFFFWFFFSSLGEFDILFEESYESDRDIDLCQFSPILSMLVRIQVYLGSQCSICWPFKKADIAFPQLYLIVLLSELYIL